MCEVGRERLFPAPGGPCWCSFPGLYDVPSPFIPANPLRTQNVRMCACARHAKALAVRERERRAGGGAVFCPFWPVTFFLTHVLIHWLRAPHHAHTQRPFSSSQLAGRRCPLAGLGRCSRPILPRCESSDRRGAWWGVGVQHAVVLWRAARGVCARASWAIWRGDGHRARLAPAASGFLHGAQVVIVCLEQRLAQDARATEIRRDEERERET